MTAAARPRAHHQPERTCVACRTKRRKRDLVRLVRSPEGAFAIDESGRARGRGAYLCRRPDCWSDAGGSRRIGQALRTTLSDGDRARLRAFAAALETSTTDDGEEASDDD